MKTLCFLAAFFCILTTSRSQNLPNGFFNDVSTIPCPFDSTQTINHPDHWLIYQTVDDKWDGEIDSTYCISVEDEGFYLKINLDQIDPAKPFFVKCLLDDNDKILLETDNLYNADFRFRRSSGVSLNLNEDCENDLCSGLIFGIEIPNSTNTGKVLRMHQTTATQFSTSGIASICFATEKFEENFLKEFVFKVTLANQDVENEWFGIQSSYIEDFSGWSDNFRIYELPITESMYWGATYNAYFSDFSIYPNGLIMYNDTTYPSPQNLSYVEAHLVENKPTQETINFFIYDYETLVYQPFSELRAGLVEGSDSLRHVLNLINNGGTICMSDVIDFAFNGSTHYVHQGGTVDFHGTTSCMIFKNGGTLNVAENTTFYYGNGGEGMLAICNGSTINIAKGGALEIDNHMVLKNCSTDQDPQIFMELNPGCTLRFAENARLSNMSGDPSLKLNIYMNGGVLEDHLLTAAERQLINRIYPEPDARNNLTFSPNPTDGRFIVSMILANEDVMVCKIFDLNGRLVRTLKVNTEKGYNEIAIDLHDLQSGMYFLKLDSGELNVCEKLMKL